MKCRLAFLIFLLTVVSGLEVFSQCFNGTQPECACETAPVLCSIDELDGYVFSMTSFQHPDDGPTPICPGANTSQSNNPTWFAFTAWCTNLTLRVSASNCVAVQNTIGFQIAIYADCNFNQVVSCNAEIQDCNTNSKILTLNGLQIGDVYYFLVDGCLGSHCTVTIDILGVCGDEEIAPWTLPMIGDTNPCVGDRVTYQVESLFGADLYHWFIDGNLTNQTPGNSFTMDWLTPGTYQLCVDASHDPCVPITDDPLPLCITINVHQSEAGVLIVSPNVLCTNEYATILCSGYTPGPDNNQMILITDASGTIVEIIVASSGTFTSATVGIFHVYSYNYLIAGGSIPVIGNNIGDIDCVSACCDLESLVIMVQTMEATVSNIVCHNSGSGNDPTDDTFTFEVLVSGYSGASGWLSADGTLSGSYDMILVCGPYLIAGGPISFDLFDVANPTCLTSIAVIPPQACSYCLQTIDAGPGSTINCIQTVATLTGTSSDVGTYQWTGPDFYLANTLIATVSDSGWYFLSASYANQCNAKDSVFVDMDREFPMADAGSDQHIDCNQLEVLIDGSGSVGNNLQFQWTNTQGAIISTQPTTWVDAAGQYFLWVRNSTNGCISLDSVEVTKDSDTLGWFSINVVPENCYGENNGEIDVTGISGGLPPFIYTLNDTISSPDGQFINLSPGLYTLNITDANGCMLDTFLIIEPGIFMELNLPDSIVLTEGQTGHIQAMINVPLADLLSIHWSPQGFLSCDSCLSTIFQAIENQLFQLTVIHERGCLAIGQLNILVIPKAEIYIPNTFSPNQDGINDFFTIYVNDGVSSILEMNIYDRWGEHLYQSQNLIPNQPERGWDGTFHGQVMSPGVYVYAIKVLLADGKEGWYRGDVTLMR